MKNEEKVIERCNVCLQPTTVDYKFYLTYYEVGEKITKSFCGASCLRHWIETELDKTHLNELDVLE